MDPAVFIDVEGGSAAQDGLVSSWKMFKDLLEVFYRLQVAPEQDFEYHWSTVPCVSETIWARN